MRIKLITFAICFSLIISLSGCIEEQSFEEPEEKPVETNMIYVDDGGGQNFTKIQSAIDNASSGDTIFVYHGTYNETVVINKSITLLGENSEKPVIFYERGLGDAANIVLIDANNCTFNGFKITASPGVSEIIGITIYSSNNTISNNSIANTTKGIEIGPGYENNTIIWNNISYNKYAIRVQDATKNKIFLNMIAFNERGILFCCGSIGNMVYLNTFKENSVWNGYDLFHNQWDNGSVGNYWDDYIGSDNDGDGIGDTPYNITGDRNQDNYPLMTPDLW